MLQAMLEQLLLSDRTRVHRLLDREDFTGIRYKHQFGLKLCQDDLPPTNGIRSCTLRHS